MLLGERPRFVDVAPAVDDLGGRPRFFGGGASLLGWRVPSLVGGADLGGRPRFFGGGGASSLSKSVSSSVGGADLGSWPRLFGSARISLLGAGTELERSATA